MKEGKESWRDPVAAGKVEREGGPAGERGEHSRGSTWWPGSGARGTRAGQARGAQSAGRSLVAPGSGALRPDSAGTSSAGQGWSCVTRPGDPPSFNGPRKSVLCLLLGQLRIQRNWGFQKRLSGTAAALCAGAGAKGPASSPVAPGRALRSDSGNPAVSVSVSRGLQAHTSVFLTT